MIKIENIHKSYGKQEVLKGVNFSCETGKIQALLGANGAGKSTLINIMSNLLEFDGGTFSIDGEEITLSNYSYKRKIGFVFEHPIYIEKLSAREYLEFVAHLYSLPKSEIDKRISELLDFFNLPDDNKFIDNYSKGMQSKISLAAAIIHNPKYLILDEPFDGVDFVSIQNITKLFKEMAEGGLTILVTSHQYDIVASLCDNFALLKDGKIIFNLAMNELAKQASQEYADHSDPVKSYLDNLISDQEYKSLSWT